MPQFDTTFFASQIFWTIVSFAVLYAVLKKWLLPLITASLDKRTSQIEKDIEIAEQARLDMEAMKERYALQISEVDAEVEKMFKDAEARIAKKREESLHELEAEIQKKKLLLVQDEESLRKHLIEEIRHDSSDFIMAATERILEQKFNEEESEDLEHLIEDLADELPEKNKQTRH